MMQGQSSKTSIGASAMALLASLYLASCAGDPFTSDVGDASAEKPVDAAVDRPVDTSMDTLGDEEVVDGGLEGSADVIQEASESGVAACDPLEQPPQAVYVSANMGSDTTGNGSASSPLGSVGKALAVALQKNLMLVVLDAGVYSESISLQNSHGGLTVMGGWKMDGNSWKRMCSPEARNDTVLASPSPVGLEAKYGSDAFTLRTLTVKATQTGKAQPDKPGKSCYGILVHGATLILEDVAVEACEGQSGGQATVTIGAKSPDCTSLETNCSDGQSGSDSGPGESAQQGRYLPEGYEPGNGKDGTPGVTGHNGIAGETATSGSVCVDACPMYCDGVCDTSNSPKSSFIVQGKCGCGGIGGSAGGGGRGGGGSFGIYAEGNNSIVKLFRSSVRALAGGDGTAGLPGAPGSSGSPGKKEQGTCHVNCKSEDIALGGCQCVQNQKKTVQAKAGGPGGNGTRGGAGGGGAGGPSIAVLQLGGAQVTWETTTLLKSNGGKAGDSKAAAGRAQEQYIVP